MALKLLSALYIGAALFGILVLVAPGNAKSMFFGSGSRVGGFAAAVHGWLTLGVIAACGLSGWIAPQHSPALAWSVVLVAFFGHLLVALVQRSAVCVRCLATGTAIQALAAAAVTLASK